MAILIIACSPQRRINRAKQIVLTNKEAFDTVGSIWATLNPCVSDTVLTTGVDTIYSEKVESIDTVFMPKENIKYVYKTLYKTIDKKSTAYVVDGRQIGILNEQIHKLQLLNKDLQLAITNKDLAIIKETKHRNKLWYWIIGLAITFVISHILRSKFKL